MKGRPAPIDRNELVRRPELRECIGKFCPVVKSKGRCYEDSHHLYWPKVMYLGESSLAFAFRSDPLNIVEMARCRHSGTWKRSLHEKYTYAPVPPDDTMATYIDESGILRSCSNTAIALAHKIKQVERDKRRLDRVRASVQEAYEEKQDHFLHLADKIQEFEIVPTEVVKEVILPNLRMLVRRYPETNLGALALIAN